MTDIVDKATRARWMAGIGGKDTRPELVVRRYLHRNGLRYVLNDRRLSGSPDIVLPRYRVCLFVHGCYWHRHVGCKFATTPSTRPEFWARKFQQNVVRDRKNVDALLATGWRVIVLWECGIRGSNPESRLDWLPAEIRLGDLAVVEWPSRAFAGIES